MPPFPKPRFQFSYSVRREKANLDRFFKDPVRAIPPKKSNEIDLATWNIANLGVQKRGDNELKLIAHILSKFDIIAVQEVNADLGHFNTIMKLLKRKKFDMIVSDVAGNSERLAVVYRTDVLRPRQLFGELDYNPNGKVVDGKFVIKPKKQSLSFGGKTTSLLFYNFSRNPFLSTWEVLGRKTSFMLANVHIYFGKARVNTPQFKNRLAEVFYLSNWAREQQTARKKAKLYESNVILIGDMNIPKADRQDVAFRALTRRGMRPSKFSTETGTTLQEFKAFDQIVFTNRKLNVTKINNQAAVVFDFDNFTFPDLFRDRSLKDFKAWTRFAVSDHRPLFVRLKV
jgi:exonuclease III